MIFVALVRRDLVRQWRSASMALPVAFFLLVATLFPFAIGPEASWLARAGGGVVWTAALLAALLPVERLVAADRDSGVLDQLAVRGISEELVAAAKIAAHWIGFGPPLLLASAVAAGLFGMAVPAVFRLLLGLLIGTPGLAALAVAAGALVAGLRGAGALSGLLMLPLAVPLLIFGAGALEYDGAFKLLGATSLTLLGGAPFLAGAAIRAARD